MKENTIAEISSYELSVNQKNQWAIDDNESSVFYNQIVVKLNNNVEITKLKEAIHSIILKNETLSFKALKVTNLVYPKQIIEATNALEFFEISVTKNDAKTDSVQQCLDYPYDIAKNAPIRFCYVTTETSKELYIRMYSFWSDSFSAMLFCSDLEKALANTETYQKTEREVVEYQNFAAWQNELMNEPEIEGVNFWKNYAYTLGKSCIPFIDTTATAFSPSQKQIACFTGDAYTQLTTLANTKNTTVEFLLFAKLVDYLKKFGSQSITIGYTPYKRSYDELKNTFGAVTKALPIVINTENDKGNYEDAIKNNLASIDVWADYFYINREKSKQLKKEYFNYNFEYIDVATQKNNSYSTIESFYTVTDLFDIKISCLDTGEAITVDLYYDNNKITESILAVVKAQLTAEYDILSTDKAIITNVESEIIQQANNTDQQFSNHTSVLEMFAANVAETPESIAVIYQDQQISYATLDEQSNQFANHLTNVCQIEQGAAVGILLDRSEWFVIAMLGILKAGAYYIPIDTNYPEERIQFILQDSSAKIVVTNEKQQNKLTLSDEKILIASNETIYQNTTQNFEANSITASSTAYSIYTSGSTGTPKGCKITHGNLVNYIQWANQYYFTETTGNWGLITSLSFDLTVTALYTSLTRGKKLFIGNNENDILHLLKESFTNPAIDTLKLTPTHLTILKDLKIERTNVRTIICGGEQLQKSQLEIVNAIHTDIKVYNEYGPTETTVGCIVKEVSINDENIYIGKPIANTQISILNNAQQTVGIGVTGEIYVSGLGVSEGYIDREQLTAEKFIDIAGTKHYKTGDIGRWLPDGNIEYIGRIDDQVKIRGYRVELGEIEKAIAAYEGVEQAVVLVYEEDNVKDLAAFVTSNKTISQEELRNTLLKNFPDYMVPSSCIQVPKIPLTTHGKIDKKELLEIREQELLKSVEYVAPRNPMEEKITTIWQKLFKKDQIGIKDDFFFLGGHSITLIKLINYYQTTFGVKLEFNQFFINTTVESQAAIISTSLKYAVEKIEKALPAESYPLSLVQRRLWLLSQNKDRSIAYNMYSYNNIGEVDELCFKKAIHAIIARHEALRTLFKKDDSGDIRQWIVTAEELNFEVQIEDLSQSENFDQDFETYIKTHTNTPFDLENGPLIKVSLIKKSESEYMFYKNMHHIIADNWSLDVLTKEFQAFYMQYKFNINANLEELPIQYKDYAVWQAERKSSEAFAEKKEYWLRKFQESTPKMSLLFSKERPAIKTYNGIEFGSTIPDPVISEFFNAAQSEKGMTPFMKALAVLNILLYHNSFQTDLVVGSPVAGRDNPQLKNQIGLFINTIVFRNTINVNDDFTTFLETIKADVVEVYKHNDYPFDLLVEDLNVQVDLSRNPLFDIMLVVTHENEEQTDSKEIIEKIEYDSASKFDLTFYLILKENTVDYRINFNTDLFELESMQLLISQFTKLVKLLAENSTKTILEYCQEIKDEKTKHEHQEFLKSFSEGLEEDF